MTPKRQRPDSYEASLTADELEQLHLLLSDRSLSLADVQKEIPRHRGGRLDGKVPSTKTLSTIARRLRTESVLSQVEAVAKMMEAVRKKATPALPAQSEATLDIVCDLVGQEVIEKTVSGIDGAGRTKAARILLKRADQKRLDERLKLQSKTDTEKGLDALYESIKANPQARELFEQLRSVIAKAA